ncbi:hypothetical protein GOBAR_DD27159 [Gossypium barbadense]|nr:hypothetical protein GOBAR_DD27159 [Gossypium barbadense]
MASLSAQIPLCLALMMAACLMIGINGSIDGAQREFDYFALSLQWPGTICHKTRHCCSSNACCRGLIPVKSNSPTEFTIHGLWPDYNDGTWPSCCYRSQFDVKESVLMTSFGSRALSLFLNVRRFQHCLMHLRSTGHRYIVANHQLASVEKVILDQGKKTNNCFVLESIDGEIGMRSGSGVFHLIRSMRYLRGMMRLCACCTPEPSSKYFLLFMRHRINLKQSDGCKGRESKGMLMPKKHGTCSSPVIRDEYSYFITTLNVYFKYNVTFVP